MDTKQTSSPKTLQEAIVFFSDANRALAYVMPLVWPHGVVCPHCGTVGPLECGHHFIASRRIWRCYRCQKQFSVKMGTVMEDSPLGLDKWLCAMWLIANAKNGISSYEIHRALGVTQKSAWFLLHRIRLAMKTGTFKKMDGIIESDETYVGGKVQNFKKGKIAKLRAEAKVLKPGKPVSLARVVKKAIVMGMLQRGQNGNPSQMRAFHVESARISPSSRNHPRPRQSRRYAQTDTLPSYQGMGKYGFIHSTINHAVRYVDGNIHTNGVENFWALLKRIFKGTYIAVEPFHLHAYLDEQIFRFNNRKLNDGERMMKVTAGVSGKRLTYKRLTGKEGIPMAA